jgi:arylsulfatase A-like enzyme
MRQAIGVRWAASAVILATGLVASTQYTLAASDPAPMRPNVLVILADDLGYADVGFNGCKDIPTPNIDALAHDGLRCTNAYVTHPYCSPSRAGLLTGRYQLRFGHERNPVYFLDGPQSHRQGLPVTETLLPQYLRTAGYATGWIGKWHLGSAPELRPENRGFSDTFGFLGGGHHYLNWQVNPNKEYFIPIERDGKPVAVQDHLTVTFGNEAASFIHRHEAEPWFLYLAFNAPHSPNEPTAERLARFASIPKKGRRAYAAQVSLLDDAVGQTLKALHDTNQTGRTLVIFLSDNGGPLGNGADNTPLRGQKGDTYEGGIHVPFAISWPGHIPTGKDYTATVSTLDLFPTALAMAGVAMPTDKPHDGVDLLPYLTGEKTGTPNEQLFWRETESGHGKWGARDNALKLVRQRTKPDELYNLFDDLIEQHDLAGTHADDLHRLAGELEAWQKLAAPLAFGGQGPEK